MANHLNMDENANLATRTRLMDIDPREIEWNNFASQLKVAQIIVLALTMGVAMFTAIVLISFNGFRWQPDVLTWLGLGVALGAIPLSMLIPGLVVSAQAVGEGSASNDSDAKQAIYEQWFAKFQVALIIGCALLEGAAFLNVVAFNIDAHPFSLVAVAVCIALMLARFPTRLKAQSWIAAKIGSG